MYRNINCIYYKPYNSCSCPNVKRSLFGIGPKYCKDFMGDICEHQQMRPKPNIHPPAQSPKKSVMK